MATRLPARDLNPARKIYSDKLGLEPIEQRPGGLRYQGGNSFFVLFESAGEAAGGNTQIGREVDDFEANVEAPKARSAVFEEYDLPGIKTVDGIAENAGNYPNKGVVRKARGSKTVRAICLALVNLR